VRPAPTWRMLSTRQADPRTQPRRHAPRGVIRFLKRTKRNLGPRHQPQKAQALLRQLEYRQLPTIIKKGTFSTLNSRRGPKKQPHGKPPNLDPRNQDLLPFPATSVYRLLFALFLLFASAYPHSSFLFCYLKPPGFGTSSMNLGGEWDLT